MGYIGKLPSVSFVMFKELLPMGFIIQLDVLWILLVILILIGLVIALIGSPLQDMFSIWVLVPYVGQEKRNLPLLSHPQKLNIKELSMLLFRLFGCKIFSLSWVSHFLNRPSFGVTIKVH